MRYERMLPHQIRTAIDEAWPVVLPLGVLEYHGEHLPVGMDTLCVVRVVEILEQEMDLVVLPPFYYGAASYAVEPPEGKGTFQVDPDGLVPFARQVFRSALRVGFRNIHCLIHHQSENFVAGMPTDLSFKLAARQTIFEWLEKERGEGWWGDNSMADYYDGHARGDNPFNWIQVHALMDSAIIGQYDFDHAARGETSTMLSLDPDSVDMDRVDTSKWYQETAPRASAEYGDTARDLVLTRLRKILGQAG